MIMVLMQMKYGCMAAGFIRRNMAFLVTVERPYKGHHQITLQDGYPTLNILLEKVLER